MSAQRDPEVVLAAWLDDGPTELPSSTRRAITTAVRTTPQARAGLGPLAWRPHMSRLLTLAGAAAVVAVAVGVFAIAVPRSPGGVGGVGGVPPPSASPSPTPSPTAPQPTVGPLPSPFDTSGWKTYTSDRYGFSIAYPPTWSLTPSSHQWSLPADLGWPNGGWEHFLAPDSTIGLGVFSVPVTPGTTVDSWLAATCPGYTEPCTGIRERAVDVTMDGHPGLLVPFTGDLQVFTLVGDGIYVIACGQPAGAYDSVRIVESYLSTMRLLPGGPASESPSPS